MGLNKTGENVTEVTIEEAFNALRDQRMTWENEWKSVHDKLYSLIAETYAVYLKASNDDVRRAADRLNIKMTASTTNAIVAAKLVFGVQDSKRTSMIGKVLEAAKQAQLTGDEVPDWIRKAGGIERIRLANADTGAASSPADQGRSKAKALTVAKFVVPADDVLSVSPDKDGFLVHLSRRNAAKDHDIVYILNDETVLNAVFAAIEKAEKAKTEKEKSAVTPAAANTVMIEVDGRTSKGLKAVMAEAVLA